MTIHIDDLHFECIIGLLDFERLTPQRVIVTCRIEYTYQENRFINYADVAQSITSQMQEKKFELLESALEYLCVYLKEHYHNIDTLYLKISKPDILNNASVGLSHFYTCSQT
jgi:dihydroneopterin aldolase